MRYFSKSRIAYKEKTLEIRAFYVKTFTLKPIFDKQILKKIFGVSNKKEYFRSNKSHHASQRCVPRWDFAFYKGYMDYDKQPINVYEQVALQIIPILIYMPWAFHKDGKTNLYGDSSLVFGLTHFS